MKIATGGAAAIADISVPAQATNMWITRYRAMAELLYAVRRRLPQLPVLGMSLLHPRHSLPADQLKLLSSLEDARPSTRWHPSLVWLVMRWLRCVLYGCRETFNLLWVKPQVWPMIRRLSRQPAQVLIKTWCFGPDHVNDGADFYFGTLVQRLQARGISSLLLCGDTRERLDAAFAKAVLRRSEVRAVPDEALIPVWAPLGMAAQQLICAITLRHLARREADPQLARVYAAAAKGSVQPITLRNALHFYRTQAAVKRWDGQVLVTLYEGQPWEKPSWFGARAANAGCVIVGYQHTIVQPHSLELLAPRRAANEIAAPDVVLCVGEVTRAMLSEGHRPFGTRFVAFGTHRLAPTPTDTESYAPVPSRRTVLVLPEGIPQEARLLFDFATQLAMEVPDHHFIFRSHPVLPFEQIRATLRTDPSRAPNIELAGSQPMSADLVRSSVVLYRGSSAVLHALLHGLKPVYVHRDDTPDIDPLFEIEQWREWSASPDEAAQLLQLYAQTDSASASEQWRRAAEYARAYLMPVTDASIDQFIEAADLS